MGRFQIDPPQTGDSTQSLGITAGSSTTPSPPQTPTQPVTPVENFMLYEDGIIMQNEDGASFLYGICKRARKYWLGVTTITQDVNDFMKSSYGQPIITNSSLQVLMKQSSATIDVVQKIFNLTEGEKYLLLEAEVGEGIFFAGQKHVAIKSVASYTEDQIITTSPKEVLRIKKEKEL